MATLGNILNSDMMSDFAAFVTAMIAVVAMVQVGKQEWRRPADMHARRICLAVLAAVSMTHALSPENLPATAQQLVLAAFLILVVIGRPPRTDRLPSRDA